MDLLSLLVVKVSSLDVEEYIAELVYVTPILKLKVKVNNETNICSPRYWS